MASSRTRSSGILGDVLRPVLSWPLRSWTRLITVLVGVCVVVWIVGRLSSGGGDAAAAPSSTATTAPKATASSTSTAGPNAAVAAQRAQAFVTAWGNPSGKSAATWYGTVQPLADSTLAQGLKLTDPKNVPAQRVTGPATVQSAAGGNAIVTVPTSAGGVTVTMVAAPGGTTWLADSITPVSSSPSSSTSTSAAPKPAPKKPAPSKPAPAKPAPKK